MAKKETVFTRDTKNKTLSVVREFDAPLETVWDAWTKSQLLDKWWAPGPYKNHTKTMDFREGGFWHYSMTGPNDFRVWAKVNYHKINPYKQIVSTAVFSDEAGGLNESMPTMHWDSEFVVADQGTKVVIAITFDKEADLETIVKMGFQEGLSMGFDNLDGVLVTS